MYENRHISEPKWKSWIVQTTTPLFTPDQCRQIIASGRAQKPQQAKVGMGKPGGGTDTKKRVTTISWIPFKEMEPMYRDLNNFIQKANEKHFGGLKEYRASEGREVLVPYRGQVSDTIQEILGGLRSACTYVGASELKHLTKCTTFVKVNNQYNSVFA